MKARQEEGPGGNRDPQNSNADTTIVPRSTSAGLPEAFTSSRWSDQASTTTHASRMGRLEANLCLLDRVGRHWWLLNLEHQRRLRETS